MLVMTPGCPSQGTDSSLLSFDGQALIFSKGLASSFIHTQGRMVGWGVVKFDIVGKSGSNLRCYPND